MPSRCTILVCWPRSSRNQESIPLLSLQPLPPLQRNRINETQDLIAYFTRQAVGADTLLESKTRFLQALFQHFVRSQNAEYLQHRIDEAKALLSSLLTRCDTVLHEARYGMVDKSLYTRSVIRALRFLETQYPEIIPHTQTLKNEDPNIEKHRHYKEIQPPVEVDGSELITLMYVQTFSSKDRKIACFCIVNPQAGTRNYIDTNHSGALLPDKKSSELEQLFTASLSSFLYKKTYAFRASDYFTLKHHDLTIPGNKEKLTRELGEFFKNILLNPYTFCRQSRWQGTDGYTTSYSELLSFFRSEYRDNTQIVGFIDGELTKMAQKGQGYLNQFSGNTYLGTRAGQHVQSSYVGGSGASARVSGF